jgi:hypothetical protein
LPPVQRYLFIGSYFNKEGSGFIQPDPAIARAKAVRLTTTACQYSAPGCQQNKKRDKFS